jgi:hypothetical protein
MELERELLARPHEDDLAAVAVRGGEDELIAPRLLDPFHLHGEAVEVEQVR